MQSIQQTKNSEVMLTDLYLKGVLKEMLLGKPISFHTRLYDEDFLYEKIRQMISRECFRLAKSYWQLAKAMLDKNNNNTPFIYFDETTFRLMERADGELYFSLEEEKIIYDGYEVVVSPMFYQEAYDLYTDDNEYIHYHTARILEDYIESVLNNNQTLKKPKEELG